MCLLIKQPEGVTFSDEWIKDFYTKNDDGFGYAYAEGDTIYTNKVVGTYEDVLAVYKQVAGKAAALHFRMQTHGHIDLTNCHPYRVLSQDDGYPLYLMHNGILSTGNSADVSKSDTWHYIQDFLRPILLKNPELFMDGAFKELVEHHIGSGNKFILMDAYGNTEIYNESKGHLWEATPGMEKAWMSNTYAWSASKAGVGYTAPVYSTSRYPTTYASDYYTTPSIKARAFATNFFAILRKLNAWPQYQSLTYSQVQDYYEYVGETYGAMFLEAIQTEGYNPEEIQDEIVSTVEAYNATTPKQVTTHQQQTDLPLDQDFADYYSY